MCGTEFELPTNILFCIFNKGPKSLTQQRWCSVIAVTRSWKVFSPGLAGDITLRSNLYAFCPITGRNTDCFFSSSAIPFTAKNVSNVQHTAANLLFPLQVCQYFRIQQPYPAHGFSKVFCIPFLLPKYVVQWTQIYYSAIGLNELQATAFCTQ